MIRRFETKVRGKGLYLEIMSVLTLKYFTDNTESNFTLCQDINIE